LRTIEWEPSDRIPMDSSYVCGLREWAWGFDFRINSRVMQEGFLRACARMYISIRYYLPFLREHEWSGDTAYFPAKVDFKIDFDRLKLQVIRYQFMSVTRAFLNKIEKSSYLNHPRLGIYFPECKGWYKIDYPIFMSLKSRYKEEESREDVKKELWNKTSWCTYYDTR